MTGTDVSIADRFTGCLLGLAIGDALGVAGAYQPRAEDRRAVAPVEYAPRPAEDGSEEIPAGQFSLNTELALCLLETVVTSNGFVDPELATYRFENAVQQTAYLPDERELRAITFAADSEEFQRGGDEPSVGYPGPVVRAIPVSMAHALSDLNIALLTREILRSTLLTDANPVVVNGALAVAHAVRLALRQEVPLQMLIGEVLSLIDEDAVAQQLRLGFPSHPPVETSEVVATALHAVVLGGGDFEPTLGHVGSLGGASHLTGAIAGALTGALTGAAAIPENLVDGLEGRAYVLMAAPALLRTAQMRAGLMFQLHVR